MLGSVESEKFSPAQLLGSVAALAAVYAMCLSEPSLGLFAFGTGFFAIVYYVFALPYRLFTKSEHLAQTARRLLLAVAVSGLGFTGFGMGVSRISEAHEAACAPVIAALEAYRLRMHRYPEKLAEMVPKELLEVPPGFDDSFRNVHYRRWPADEHGQESYSLMFNPAFGVPLTRIYNPVRASWNTLD